jgi:hypothetical protein
MVIDAPSSVNPIFCPSCCLILVTLIERSYFFLPRPSILDLSLLLPITLSPHLLLRFSNLLLIHPSVSLGIKGMIRWESRRNLT